MHMWQCHVAASAMTPRAHWLVPQQGRWVLSASIPRSQNSEHCILHSRRAPRPPRSRWAHRRCLWRRHVPRRWPGAAALLPRHRRRLPVRPVVGSFYSDSAQSMITNSMITARPEPSKRCRQVAAVCGYHFAAKANQRFADCVCASASRGSPAGAPAARGRGRALMPQPPGPAPAAARCCAWQRPGGRGRPSRRPPPPLPPARRPAGCAAASPLRRPAALPPCCASAAARLWEGHRGACGNAERGTQYVLGYAAACHLTSQVLDSQIVQSDPLMFLH